MAYPMLGTRIVIDEEKVLREGEYDLDKMYALIDELAKKCDLIKKDKHTYVCKGNNMDLANLWQLVSLNLVRIEWITKNIKEWTWLSEREGNSDMISFFKAEKKGIWQ